MNNAAKVRTIFHFTKLFPIFMPNKGSDRYLPLPLNQFQTITMKVPKVVSAYFYLSIKNIYNKP